MLISSFFVFNLQFQLMGYITRSWPRGLVLFLQPARMNPFGRAEKDHAEEVRRDHECLKNNRQKRINAAAAPDALNASA
jgi:hypothetical protein